MILGDIQRFYLIIRVMLNYGLDELIPVTRFTLPLRLVLKLMFWIPNLNKDLTIGERLRLALQELGPVWIKLGQMLSTRRDLFMQSIVDQLTMLQDRVQPFDGELARQHIEHYMGQPVEHFFYQFEQEPLASASIAQVHTAILKKNGKNVVIKVIRPDIMTIIKADMRLMSRLAIWLTRLLPASRRFRPIEVVLEYEKKLLDELNLLREAANSIQLRRNFADSPMLYIPEVYPDYCSEKIMVMERIYGIPVNDVVALKKQGTNMKLLAERGVQVFFTQVFRDSFFHGDMHPGNIFVSYEHPDNPKYIGIDCGIVGSLNKKDQRYLAENFIAFFNRDYRKVAELHIDSGWVPPDTNVEDFEFSLRVVCELMFEKPLSEISFGHVLLNLFNTAKRFNMEVQPQLVLLQKTLFYIEGVGRQLYPQLDLWKTAKPFLEDWIKDQIGLYALFSAIKYRAPYWAEKLPELPELLYEGVKNHNMLKKSLNLIVFELREQRIRHSKAYLILSAILLFIGIFVLLYDHYAEVVPILLVVSGIIGCVLSWKLLQS
ncbi:ubiquinone biosynthesis regulatory protein kinase UbiB [Candidatus Palibaumannia cicadellinicola]|uniref:Probable protein kinase UbiB n=1 Tax=Candidatus Palibaumannia cicadellinicola TaxID=186490 RepID=A0A0K2BJZ2_9GAMM|nr:ubiquinone biosynthesis regulatory protein kinase UbiB [Candidatus Baumannia cicadellinicola]AKZ65645.1 Ubiquinone biosynthesis monooxygenase [Candidatus Baumannia cicadellinicola]